ncbi:MAG: hypothetical protein PF589_10005 [Gammaproteobacteria bacterium]|jgi:hypothetical protein|nr:hypothetical protein [Gammaproteobacteria bacterium]
MNVKFEKPKKNRQGVPVKRESRQREWDPDDVTKNNDPAVLINIPLQMFTPGGCRIQDELAAEV